MASGDPFPDYKLENPCWIRDTYLLIDTTPDDEKATIEAINLGILDQHVADAAANKHRDKYRSGKYKLILETRDTWIGDRRYYIAALKLRPWNWVKGQVRKE